MEHKYTVVFRRIKYPRLEFRTGNLNLILPTGTDPVSVIKKHNKWILYKSKLIAQSLNRIKNKDLINRSEAEFRILVQELVERNAVRLRVTPNIIRYRKMETKWGSCSSNKNLGFNTNMRYLPNHIVEYVVYHELAHLHVKRHNAEFWKIIADKYKNYKTLEKYLSSYWFLIKRRA
jgi:predicted metal-dependent hydrolase